MGGYHDLGNYCQHRLVDMVAQFNLTVTTENSNMKCPECLAAGLKSRVESLGGTVTLMGWAPYWDEEGVYHSHDPNIRKSEYGCSNGHAWSEEYQAECPASGCDYGKDSKEPNCDKEKE